MSYVSVRHPLDGPSSSIALSKIEEVENTKRRSGRRFSSIASASLALRNGVALASARSARPRTSSPSAFTTVKWILAWR